MLSRGRMAAPHAGQAERGKTTDSRRGRRWMTTLRKLPITAPKTKKRNPMAHSISASRGAGGTGIGPARSEGHTGNRVPPDPAAATEGSPLRRARADERDGFRIGAGTL